MEEDEAQSSQPESSRLGAKCAFKLSPVSRGSDTRRLHSALSAFRVDGVGAKQPRALH